MEGIAFPAPRPDDPARRADNPDLHAVLDEIEAAMGHALGDVPLPPTVFDLALAIDKLALAVTVLACRTLGRDQEKETDDANKGL